MSGQPPAGLVALGMPKWGLSMKEGRVTAWLAGDGDRVAAGEEVFEVETEKIDGAVEAPAAGTLRRVAPEGAVVPVGGLVGVVAEESVPDADVDAFVAAFQAAFVPGDAAETGGATSTVEVGGRRLQYLDTRGPDTAAQDASAPDTSDPDSTEGAGGATPVVLLHGFGGDLNTWLFTTPALAERRRVLALDLPGHGGSSRDVGDGSLDTLTGAVVGFLDAAGVGRAHLVGHSMGGAVALGVALAHRDRVASLTLVSSTGLGADINAGYLTGFVDAGRRRDLKPVLQLLFADPGLVTRQLVDDVLAFKRLDGVPEALRTIADAMFPGGRQARVLAGELAGLGVPLLGVWGRQDQIVPVAHTAALRPHGQVEILDGCGHSPHMEASGEVNRLVNGFLATAEPRTPPP